MQSDRYDLYQSGGILAPPTDIISTPLIEIYIAPGVKLPIPYNG